MQEGKLIFGTGQRRELPVHSLFIASEVGSFWGFLRRFAVFSQSLRGSCRSRAAVCRPIAYFSASFMHLICFAHSGIRRAASAEPGRCLVPGDPTSERMTDLSSPRYERSGPRIFRTA